MRTRHNCLLLLLLPLQLLLPLSLV